jgi:hypothetical protein
MFQNRRNELTNNCIKVNDMDLKIHTNLEPREERILSESLELLVGLGRTTLNEELKRSTPINHGQSPCNQG